MSNEAEKLVDEIVRHADALAEAKRRLLKLVSDGTSPATTDADAPLQTGKRATSRTMKPDRVIVGRRSAPGGGKSISVQVLELLQASNREWTAKEVSERVPCKGTSTISNALYRLIQDRVVERTASGYRAKSA